MPFAAQSVSVTLRALGRALPVLTVWAVWILLPAQDRTSAGMWETLELPAYARQPKKVYHRDEDTGTPSSASAEPEPEPEPESGARESSDEILPKGTAVIVSGLVSASAAKHNGRSGRVLRYDQTKERYAVQLDPSGGDGDATKLLVRPECLLEDLDAAVEAEGGGAEEQLQSKGAGAAVAAEPTPPPVRAPAAASVSACGCAH